MSKVTLRELYEQHQGKVSDKWSLYLSEYERLLSGYRDLPVRLLEIGVQNGGSLEIWSCFFPAAQQIIGCDIDPNCAKLRYTDPRISVVVSDANTDAAEVEIAARCPRFELIIDDGSHVSGDIVRSFARYFQRLSDGGLFIAEDLHCSYQQAFEGGLFDPTSSMAFFKRLADVVNQQHWGVPRSRKEILTSFMREHGFDISEALLSHIHSVEFVNSLCVIRKNAPAANLLGERFIAGTEEAVASGHPALHRSLPIATDEQGNRWSAPAQLPEDELAAAQAELARLREIERNHVQQASKLASLRASLDESIARVGQLQEKLRNAERQLPRFRFALEQAQQQRSATAAQLTEHKRRLEEMLASSSWRLTRPLRWLQDKNRARLVARHRRSATGTAPATQPPANDAAAQPAGASQRTDYNAWLNQYDVINEATRARMRRHVEMMVGAPLISVVMPTYNANPVWLRAAIESVRAQIYPDWELCIADDASTSTEALEILKAYAASDARIKVVFRPENGHISAASNSALALAEGEWIALMDHDDLLPEHALFWIADAITKHPDARLIYSDEDKIDEAGVRSEPYFKPDWNVDLFYSQNYFSHLGVYTAALVRKVGGLRVDMQGAQDYDLVLRCLEQIEPYQVHHIPKVLYHWRVHAQSTANTVYAKPYARLAGERALNEHFERSGIRGSVECVSNGYRVRYELPACPPLVSLIIPTRNAVALVRQCVDSILKRTTYKNYEIIIVDNGSDDAEALDYFRSMHDQGVCRVIRDDGEFNYSALNNMAVAQARGEIVGLINNDIEVITPEWLSEMVSIAIQPGVGAVGARLWYPNMTLQHGGIVLVGGVAGHAHKYLPSGDPGYFARATLLQSFSAVTGACLLVQKDRYQAVHGLNETDLKVAFNDVDFCLRLREAGLRNVWTPYAELFHHESATRGSDVAPEKQLRFNGEIEYMKQRWGDLLLFDPAYNPNLTHVAENFGLAWPPRVRPDLEIG